MFFLFLGQRTFENRKRTLNSPLLEQFPSRMFGFLVGEISRKGEGIVTAKVDKVFFETVNVENCSKQPFFKHFYKRKFLLDKNASPL